MTVVLVNGNPETPAIWDLLAEQLTRAGHGEPIRLAPPGFGAPVPPDFHATVDGYFEWLVTELERIGEPVDLVGHDVGGSRVIHVAMRRPDLISSWVSDTIGTFDPDYVWHENAQVWQRPGDGERWISAQLALTAEQRAEGLASRGMNAAIAAKIAYAFDAQMGACILSLYRSSAQPTMARLGADLPSAAARPGLAILATDDTFVGTDEQRRHSAQRAGARLHVLDGFGHWWMTQDGGRAAAAALISFWTSLDQEHRRTA
jgi:pimeloyl-ACP methyl ester carboxylesterase